jgi:hypothetical protein
MKLVMALAILRRMETDIQCPQIRMEARVLDRHQESVRSGFVMMFMPVARRRHERRRRFPIHADRLNDSTVGIEFRTHQRSSIRGGTR